MSGKISFGPPFSTDSSLIRRGLGRNGAEATSCLVYAFHGRVAGEALFEHFLTDRFVRESRGTLGGVRVSNLPQVGCFSLGDFSEESDHFL
jgi:hypothetical protein